jgi:hypothetical protein
MTAQSVLSGCQNSNHVHNSKGLNDESVREHMGWVRNVVLMNVYLDLEKPRGVGISGEGPHGAGEGNGG